jgi:septation ring formation regulator EzrA
MSTELYEKLTKEQQQYRFEQAKIHTDYIVNESQKQGYKQAVDTTKNVMAKFQKIEQKQSCLRVRFLDWLSDKLLSWSKKVHEMSVSIDSPCVIRLPEKK